MRRVLLVLGCVLFSGLLSSCINVPGDTSQIVALSSGTVNWGTASQPDVWHYQLFENQAYPCAKSGYQTFTILTPPEDVSNPTAVRPLWVWLHGGGVGYWLNGQPQGSLAQAGAGTQEGASTDKKGGLFDDVVGARFRQLRVSYCDRDAYAGDNHLDPGNPNSQITTNGLLATKAAIQYARDQLPTSKFFLHGGSAGSDGVYNVAWGLQLQGMAPAGVVADSGVQNSAFWYAVAAQNVSCPWSQLINPTTIPLITARFAPQLQGTDSEPASLVGSGQFTVPVAEVWDHGDPVGCGAFQLNADGTWTTKAMDCPGGSQPPDLLGLPASPADCKFWALAQVISSQGASSNSISIGVCVDPNNLMQSPPTAPVIDPGGTNKCNRHIVTTADARSWTPNGPQDFDAKIWSWVQARLNGPTGGSGS